MFEKLAPMLGEWGRLPGLVSSIEAPRWVAAHQSTWSSSTVQQMTQQDLHISTIRPFSELTALQH